MYTNMYTNIINYEEQNVTLTYTVKVLDDSSKVRKTQTIDHKELIFIDGHQYNKTPGTKCYLHGQKSRS